MKFVRRLQRAAHPTFLDARFHGHDVIPAKAGIQEFAQILDMSQEFYKFLDPVSIFRSGILIAPLTAEVLQTARKP